MIFHQQPNQAKAPTQPVQFRSRCLGSHIANRDLTSPEPPSIHPRPHCCPARWGRNHPRLRRCMHPQQCFTNGTHPNAQEQQTTKLLSQHAVLDAEEASIG
eukprot:1392793-Amphidinium_carterae.1